MIRRALVVLALVVSAAPAAGQSLFGVRGLGVPVDPIDPRARALGSIGTGLLGLNMSMVNPADLAGIRRRGVTATLQPFFGSDELDGRDDDVEATRFPLIQMIYPVRTRLVLALGYGGFLEHSWSVLANRDILVGADTVATQELVRADGAVAQVRLSAGYDLTPSIALGAAFGVYTGNLERELTRTFSDSANALLSFTRISFFDYSGLSGTIGARFDPGNRTRVAAALTWSTDLDAEPESNLSAGRSYDMPLRFSLGASRLLGSRLLASAGAQYTGWSTSTNFSTPGSPDDLNVRGRAVWEFGGGLEWEGLRTTRRVFPLRAGYRYAQLPFALEGDDAANEWAASVGLGLRLASDDFGPAGRG